MALFVSNNSSLLLHGNGADGSTLFIDETGKTVTAYGNAQISTAQSKFGGSSMYFDGAGDYLSTPSNADFDFGTEDFTIELFIQPASLSQAALLVGRQEPSNGMALQVVQVNSGITYTARAFGGGPVYTVNGGSSLVTTAMNHVAVTRQNNTASLWLNGLNVGSITDPTNLVCTRPLTVGIGDDTTLFFPYTGYIDDVRIVKGVALYTANFTPPAAPLELTQGTQIQIQAHDPGITKLAKYDPSQIKPAMYEVKDDLQDSMPYGLWKTPEVFNEFKGRGRITGTVKNTPGTPVFRQVRLHREPDGMFVKAVWSDPITGAYEFNGVRPDCKYTVTSYDHTQAYRAVIADNLIPTPL